MPKASAASASARIGRTWLRRKITAIAASTIEVKTISTSSWCGFETDSRSRGTVASSTPCPVPMATWALRGSVATSRAIGRSISSASVAAIVAAVKSKRIARRPRGDAAVRQEADAQRQRQGGGADPRRGRLRRAGGLGLGDREGELVRDRAGHLLADPEVVALEEHQADHELQQHERHQ